MAGLGSGRYAGPGQTDAEARSVRLRPPPPAPPARVPRGPAARAGRPSCCRGQLRAGGGAGGTGGAGAEAALPDAEWGSEDVVRSLNPLAAAPAVFGCMLAAASSY